MHVLMLLLCLCECNQRVFLCLQELQKTIFFMQRVEHHEMTYTHMRGSVARLARAVRGTVRMQGFVIQEKRLHIAEHITGAGDTQDRGKQWINTTQHGPSRVWHILSSEFLSYPNKQFNEPAALLLTRLTHRVGNKTVALGCCSKSVSSQNSGNADESSLPGENVCTKV